MSARHALLLALALPFAGGCATPRGHAPPPVYPLDRATAVTFCADGAGGPGGTTDVIRFVAADQNAPLRVEQVDWSHGLRRFHHDIDPTGLYALRWRDGAWRPSDPPEDPATGALVRRLERVPTAALEAWTRMATGPVESTVGRLAGAGEGTGPWLQGPAS